MKKRAARAAIEVGFIVFLFYANLLMGAYERSGGAQTRGLVWALTEVITTANLLIALPAAFVGYLVVELLRNRIT